MSILQMRHYPEPDSHIRDKVKVILDSSNYASKKTDQIYRHFNTQGVLRTQ